MKFLKENWVWIAAPILLFTLAVAAVIYLGDDTEEQFNYGTR